MHPKTFLLLVPLLLQSVSGLTIPQFEHGTLVTRGDGVSQHHERQVSPLYVRSSAKNSQKATGSKSTLPSRPKPAPDPLPKEALPFDSHSVQDAGQHTKPVPNNDNKKNLAQLPFHSQHGVDGAGQQRDPLKHGKELGHKPPLDPMRKNTKGEDVGKNRDKDHTMYHVVTPDPRKSQGAVSANGKTTSFFRKVGDGLPENRYSTHNPTHSVVESHGQEPKVNGVRPGKADEKSNHSLQKGGSEWHEIKPKPQSQINREQPGKKAWTGKDLQDNLIKQQDHFHNHDATNKNSEHGRATQEMLKMCNTKQCKAGPHKRSAEIRRREEHVVLAQA